MEIVPAFETPRLREAKENPPLGPPGSSGGSRDLGIALLGMGTAFGAKAQQLTPQYAAGLFDGEGCVYISQIDHAHPAKRWRIFVVVANRNESVIRSFKETFGGSIRHRYERRQNRGDIWEWVIASRAAVRFLETIGSHTIVKRRHVVNALSFALGIGEGGHKKNANGRYIEPGEIDMRKKHVLISRLLNARGPGTWK